MTGVFGAEDDFSRYDDSLRVPELPKDAEVTALAEEFSEAYEYSFSSVCFTGRASMNVTTISTGAAGSIKI